MLTVRDLHVIFTSKGKRWHAVRGINFEIRCSETVGIVGESGCGKSATAKAIVRLLPNTQLSGLVEYQGSNLIDYSPQEMEKVRGKEIGVIFQDPMTSLNPTLTIGKQILEGYRRHFPTIPHANAKRHVIHMLHQVGMRQPEEVFHSYPHTLSGGMRQRVMIAIALVCQPKLLIADEPTTALDVTIQAQILDLMQDLKQQFNMSLILITHDLSLIAKYCDQVLVMYAGQIVEAASVNDLFANPQHPYTQALLQSIPKPDQPKHQPLFTIEGTPPDLSLPLPHCSFYDRCPFAMSQCATAIPTLQPIKSSHQMACFKK